MTMINKNNINYKDYKFIFLLHRIKKIKNSNQEVPDDFLNEIHKWSLECKFT